MKKALLLIIAILSLNLMSCSGQTDAQKQQAESVKKLAEAYIAQEDYTSALGELLKLEQANPNDPDVHNYLGIVYMAKERLELAVKHFNKAISLNPSFSRARNNLGAAYMALKEWDKAIETFKPLTEDLLYTTPHYPLANLGWAYFNKKEYEISANYYARAVKIEPMFAIGLRGLGKTYMEMGKGADAVTSFEKAMEISPRFADLYFDAGRAYAMVGNKEKAIESYKKFLALTPNSPRAKDAQKMLLVLEQK